MVQPERDPCFHGICIMVRCSLYQCMPGMLARSACVCSQSRISIRSLLVAHRFSTDDDVTARDDGTRVRAGRLSATVRGGAGDEWPSSKPSEPVSPSVRLEMSLSTAESSLTSSLVNVDRIAPARDVTADNICFSVSVFYVDVTNCCVCCCLLSNATTDNFTNLMITSLECSQGCVTMTPAGAVSFYR